MVPLCIRVSDDKDGSVLEIKDKGLINNAVMDSTNYNQHWYILPHHGNEAEEVFVIASWNGQKALQWDGNVLMVKPYDHKDKAQQWTVNKKSFIVPRRNKHSMKLKAHPVVCCFYLINGNVSYVHPCMVYTFYTSTKNIPIIIIYMYNRSIIYRSRWAFKLVVLLPSESYSKSQQLYNYQQTAIKGQ